MSTNPKTPESRSKTAIRTPPRNRFGQPTATRKGATGVRITGSPNCRGCGATAITYDFDNGINCYMGPTLVDPTPLTLELAIACRLTGRRVYHHTQGITGRHYLARIFDRNPLPATGSILPAHQCGATTPTQLPPNPNRVTYPDNCPF